MSADGAMSRHTAGTSGLPPRRSGRPRSARGRRSGRRVAVIVAFVLVVVALTLALLGADRALGVAGPGGAGCARSPWTAGCR